MGEHCMQISDRAILKVYHTPVPTRVMVFGASYDKSPWNPFLRDHRLRYPRVSQHYEQGARVLWED